MSGKDVGGNQDFKIREGRTRKNGRKKRVPASKLLQKGKEKDLRPHQRVWGLNTSAERAGETANGRDGKLEMFVNSSKQRKEERRTENYYELTYRPDLTSKRMRTAIVSTKKDGGKKKSRRDIERKKGQMKGQKRIVVLLEDRPRILNRGVRRLGEEKISGDQRGTKGGGGVVMERSTPGLNRGIKAL